MNIQSSQQKQKLGFGITSNQLKKLEKHLYTENESLLVAGTYVIDGERTTYAELVAQTGHPIKQGGRRLIAKIMGELGFPIRTRKGEERAKTIARKALARRITTDKPIRGGNVNISPAELRKIIDTTA